MGARSELLMGFEGTFAWSLLEAVPDGIVIVAGSGDIVFVNDHAAHLMGYEPGDLVDRPVEDLLPEAFRAAHLAHRTRYRADPVSRSMSTGLLLSARRADGSEFPVEISLSPWRADGDGELHVMAAIRDVTDRVEEEDHFHRVLHTLDATDDGVFIFDADDLRYSYVNEGAARLVGYRREELLEMTPLHLNRHASEADYRELVASLRDHPDEPVTHSASLMRKDGIEVAVEKTYQSAPVGRTGARWVIALARDITARLLTDAQLRASEDALHQAESVLAVSEDRERIARDLHDTVIQRLFGAGLNLQAVAAVADDQVRDRIETTINDLDETIRELRTAIFSLRSRRVAPAGLRGRILQVTVDAGPGLGSEPRVEFDGPAELVGAAAADHLVAILREALSNVAHHAEATDVRVTLAVTDEIVLSVIDNGIGVKGEVLGGRGLENMASRADQLGGTCDLTARADGGSELICRLPLSSHS